MRSGLVDAAASNPDRAVVYEALAEAERDKRTRAANWVAGGVEEDSPAAGPAENTQRRNTIRNPDIEAEPAHVDSVTTNILRSDGSRRIFIGAALTSDGLRYGPDMAQLLLDLSTVAKKQMWQFTAMNPSAREDLSFTNRSFRSWSLIRISLATAVTKANCIFDAVQTDMLRGVVARDSSTWDRPQGMVRYSPAARLRHWTSRDGNGTSD